MAVSAEVEQLLFRGEQCNAYKLPPVYNTNGYKASEWQDNHIWTGVCKVTAKGEEATVFLLEPDGSVFAKCPVRTGAQSSKSMSTVLDSSRYFVLRIEDQGRHAFIGIGFNERDEAFDFKVALTDHNRVEANVAAAKALLDSAAPKEDLGLKDGQKIVVKLSGKVKNPDKKQPNKLGGGYSGVAPPPARSATGISAPPSSSISAPPRAVQAPPASVPAPIAAKAHPPPAQQAPPAQQPAAQQPNLFGAFPAAPATSAPAAAAQPNLFSTPAPAQPAGTTNLFAAGNGANLFASTPAPAPAAAAPPPQPSNSGFNDLFGGVANTAPPAAAPAQPAQPNMFAPQQQQQQQQ
eukprot:Rhum_TRINITY_DN2555_c0_g1::Rhum_TRINITY_DN2555_c0_g1_i1::g.7530::m.7530/K20069/NECAP1_2; adaptin ear-binding coat-associated protein 1/2